MQLLSKDCPRSISHDTVLTVVGVIWTKCIDIFLKYCMCVFCTVFKCRFNTSVQYYGKQFSCLAFKPQPIRMEVH